MWYPVLESASKIAIKKGSFNSFCYKFSYLNRFSSNNFYLINNYKYSVRLYNNNIIRQTNPKSIIFKTSRQVSLIDNSSRFQRYQSTENIKPPESLDSNKTNASSNQSNLNSNAEKPKSWSSDNKTKKSKLAQFITVFASGIVAFFAISYYLDSKEKKPKGINYLSNSLPGRIVPTKSIKREKNPGNIKITLYQYVTCPFCCKVRAYLDYFGYSYDVVEVNSIRRNQIDWSDYKKVPIVAVQLPKKDNPDAYEDEIIQLNDSSVIISALETFRLDPTHSLQQILSYYEPIQTDSIGNNIKPLEFNNKYFVMLHNEKMSDKKSVSERKDEREWRAWVDSKFVHVISPNVYRTLNESLESFSWFDRAGEWEKQFSSFERNLIIYLGAFVMYFVASNLKKKYNLKDDVRESLYDSANEWTVSLSDNYPFRGGPIPNLSDLALYGSMGSFEGCNAFTDMMNKNPKLKNWYEACKEQVLNSKGSLYLNNQAYYTNRISQSNKKAKK